MKQRIQKYKKNKSNEWALIYDQYGTAGYELTKNNNDVVKLLVMIRD
jgi:hypothetical protein